jgi:hypothetical protein
MEGPANGFRRVSPLSVAGETMRAVRFGVAQVAAMLKARRINEYCGGSNEWQVSHLGRLRSPSHARSRSQRVRRV